MTTLYWIRLMLRPAFCLELISPLSPGFSYRCRSGFRVNWPLPWQIPFNLLEYPLWIRDVIPTQRLVALPEFCTQLTFIGRWPIFSKFVKASSSTLLHIEKPDILATTYF